MRHALLIACATFLVCAEHAHVHACEFAEPDRLEIQPNAADTTPPSAPQVALADVQRGNDYGGGGCGAQTSCDGSAYVLLQVAASDDVSGRETIGYRIQERRNRLGNAQELVIADPSGLVTAFFRSTDDGEDDVKFELTVEAVDQAGNVSAATALTIENEGDGCQLAGSGEGALWLLGLLLLRRSRAHSREVTSARR